MLYFSKMDFFSVGHRDSPCPRANTTETQILTVPVTFLFLDATTFIEGGALLVGLLLGGPIGIGTIVVCLLMGPLIEFFLTMLNGTWGQVLRPMFQKIKVPHNT